MDFLRLTVGQSAEIMSVVATGFFMGLEASLYAARLPPLTKFARRLPAVTAVLGSFAAPGLLLLEPRVDISPAERLFPVCLIFTGDLFAIYSLHFLGRSCAILPRGRRLVTGGPYRFIRHPLYLAEAISIVGVTINFFSVSALALIGGQLLG